MLKKTDIIEKNGAYYYFYLFDFSIPIGTIVTEVEQHLLTDWDHIPGEKLNELLKLGVIVKFCFID